MKITRKTGLLKTGLALSVPLLVLVGAQAAFAGYKVKIPTAGDVALLDVTVVNLTGDYIEGGTFVPGPNGFVFTSYGAAFSSNPLGPVAPQSTGTVQFDFQANGTFPEDDDFQLPLFGFSDFANPNTIDFTDKDPGLTIDLVSEGNGQCGPNAPCGAFDFPNTITVPAAQPSSTPEPGTLVPFGLGALGLAALALKARAVRGREKRA